ncbi:bromodomain, testis-specific-like protein [Sarcoptes scabiei]|uniref:Bromodomain, testis-specific-like protein n=1 Tax=Sarcoptes scabiei TaxID=52283 RepID=A0A132AFF4_SARSC|nr:bromodomain, testis-specific-like protein [Sarcoptes scabiei]
MDELITIPLENLSSDKASQIPLAKDSNDFMDEPSSVDESTSLPFDNIPDDIFTDSTDDQFALNPLDNCNDSQVNVEESEPEILSLTFGTMKQSNTDSVIGGDRCLNTPTPQDNEYVANLAEFIKDEQEANKKTKESINLPFENLSSSDKAGQIPLAKDSNDPMDEPSSVDESTSLPFDNIPNDTFTDSNDDPFAFNPLDNCNDSQVNVEESEPEILPMPIEKTAKATIETNDEPEIGTNAEDADMNVINEFLNEAEQIAAEVPMDSNSIKILPNGIKIINGVAQMPFDRSEFNDGDQSTFKPRFTNQLQFLKTIISRDFFRNRLALPFLHPVNGLENPSYYDIIMEPMDFTTIKKRLNFLWYRSAAECIDDIRQIFINCFCFNPPSHHVYSSGQKLQEYVEMKLAKMPAEEEEIDCPPKPSLEKFMEENQRKASKRSISSANEPSNETIICLDTDPSTSTFDPQGSRRVSRRIIKPKCETMTSNQNVRVPPKVRVKKVPLNEALEDCLSFVRELFKKYHAEYAWPFWQPVSEEDFPDYRQKIEKPMDLTTIKKNIETGVYLTIDDCFKDMRLIVSNCRQYNPPDSPIIEQARSLEEMIEYRYSRFPKEYLSQKLEIKEIEKPQSSRIKLTAKRSSRKNDGPVDLDKQLKLIQNEMEKIRKEMKDLLEQTGQQESIDTSSSLISTQITEVSDSFQMQSDANEES